MSGEKDTPQAHEGSTQDGRVLTLTKPDSSSPYLHGWRLATVIGCLFFGALLVALDTNIVNVAVPKISSQFHSLGDIAWYGTAYLLTITAFQPIYGSLYKFFRTDVVYRLSILFFEVGTVLCAAATSSGMFIAGRAVAGFGAAGVLQGALSVISQVVELEKRPLYMGIVISVFIFAVCIGPPLGGVFTQDSTWRWCFWMFVAQTLLNRKFCSLLLSNLPIGGVVLVGLTIFLTTKGIESEMRKLPLMSKLKNMDPLGCLVFIGAICCLLLALQWGGQTKPWDSPTVLALLIGFVPLTTLFIYMQWRRHDQALIPLRVFLKRSIWTGAMVLFFLGASTYLVSRQVKLLVLCLIRLKNVFFLPFYFQAVKGESPIASGEDIIPFLASQLVALIVVGAVVKTWGHYVGVHSIKSLKPTNSSLGSLHGHRRIDLHRWYCASHPA